MASALPRQLKNTELLAIKMPASDADWDTIQRFALTFDGYRAWPEGVCEAIGLARRCTTLSELRTCLFFEQRSWRHSGWAPDEQAMNYIRSLVEQIRGRVALANELLR